MVGECDKLIARFTDNLTRRLVVNNERQKDYFIRRGMAAYMIDVVRFECLSEHLERRIEVMLPQVPVLQMELDFGEGFNFWWYDDDGQLHPNDSDSPSFPNYSDYDDNWDDDIPF